SSTSFYPLSLHDALPIFAFQLLWALSVSGVAAAFRIVLFVRQVVGQFGIQRLDNQVRLLCRSKSTQGPKERRAPASESRALSILDRKSTRLNSSHGSISY